MARTRGQVLQEFLNGITVSFFQAQFFWTYIFLLACLTHKEAWVLGSNAQ